MRSRFGACTLDTGSRELVRDGRAIHLTGKAFRLLEVLVLNQSRAMSKEELASAVWPGVFVSDGNLSTLVAELRKAIGDDAHDSRFIRTVYGFGYAFSGAVEEEDAVDEEDAVAPRPAARCRLVWGRKEIELREGENILGRGPEAIEWIDRDTVSRRHARIVIDGATRSSRTSAARTALRSEASR